MRNLFKQKHVILTSLILSANSISVQTTNLSITTENDDFLFTNTNTCIVDTDYTFYTLQEWIALGFDSFCYPKGFSPSRIIETEERGMYQKVKLAPQSYTYKGFNYEMAYFINGHLILADEEKFTILNSEGKELYREEIKVDLSWIYDLSFYFPKNKSKPFLITITTGMEQYGPLQLKVIDKNFNCVHVDFPDLAIEEGDSGEWEMIEPYLIIIDKEKDGIEFTFNADTVLYLGWGSIPAKDLVFTFKDNVLQPNDYWFQLPLVQQATLWAEINEKYDIEKFKFEDLNGDGHPDILIIPFNSEPQQIIVFFCKDYKIQETYTIDIGDIKYPSFYIEEGLVKIQSGSYYFSPENEIQERTYKFENGTFQIVK